MVQEGWANVSSLFISSNYEEDPRCRLNSSIIRRNSTKLQIFFKLIPRKIFKSIAQQTKASINTAILKQNIKPSKHNNPPPSELELIKFYAMKVLVGRLKKKTINEGIEAWKTDPKLQMLSFIGKNRFRVLNAFAFLDLSTLVKNLRRTFRKAIVVGTQFTVDETLFAWIGSSKSRTGLSPPKMHLERKPHKDGFVVYNLATTLQWSKLPYVVDLEPFLQSGTLTPRLAAEKLIFRIRTGHFTLDAAFCNFDFLVFCSSNHLRCTMACTSNSSALWEFGKRDLIKGEWRLFQKGDMIAGILRDNGDVLILSNAFTSSKNLSSIQTPVFSLTDAKTLAQLSDLGIKQLTKDLNLQPMLSTQQFIEEYTGWNLIAQPPKYIKSITPQPTHFLQLMLEKDWNKSFYNSKQ